MLLVFLGGGLGASARHAVNRLAFHLAGPGFPWGTLAINVLGSLAIGVAAGVFANINGGLSARLFLMTGVLGGFTTFSAFSLDALLLAQRGQWLVALAYVAASVLLSLIAVGVGYWLAQG